MDPLVLAFFKKILNSILIAMVWLALTATFGIVNENAFIGDTIKFSNIAFYAWLAASIAGLVWIYSKIWKKGERVD